MGNIALKITALLFGIAIWFIVISRQDYQLVLEVPLNFVKLPETMAIASKPPHSIHITVEGKTWDLIRLHRDISKGNTNAVAMVVDLQKAELGAIRIHLDQKNFSAPGYANVKFVEPENRVLFIDLDLDTRIVRNVPVRANATINAAQGYLLADEPKIIPEEIQVSGARNALARIIDIPTDSTTFDTLKDSKVFTVPLNFESFPGFVSPSDSSVKISVNIQKMASKVFKRVPVALIGFYDRNIYSLSPDTVSVEITGGEQVLDSITKDHIELIMEFNRFAIEDADSLPPTTKLTLPSSVNREKSIKAIELKPDKVYLKKKEEKVEPKAEAVEEADQ
ncbi:MULTISPECIES: YbbR-like domain-containing protein [unclassified Fibrobacter]|uniref:CdaR family protein n=1 Tax=unclassified Fibrobacter TaxID=2634177 RepID=UPI000D6B9C79|nr:MULTISPECIES: hypothetical protein [unclassified Fibrobacter]PWJ63730.1 YbbR domain-containing protein [Fibrobacter sp. UWR4]PZW69118.1 YbbR domain-containing protein [Fibrobacter sp. UWR1]